ncbi:MAG: hypothetical protein OEY00_12240 [Gammaproteobacteria bacterium]|nr:hypothetical protein [Gammaproteobacteria bacterium]
MKTVEIPVYIYWGLGEAALVSFILFIIYFIRFRSAKKKLKKLSSNTSAVNNANDSKYTNEEIENLERFREYFFKLKEQYDNLTSVNDQLEIIIDKNIDIDTKELLSDELNAIKARKLELELMVKTIHSELSTLLNEYDVSKDIGSRATVNDTVNDIQELVSRQNKIIQDLQQQLEQALTEKTKNDMLEKLAELESKNDELSVTLDVLQDENQFLQNHITTILRQEMVRETLAKDEMRRLKTQYTSMEKQYLDLYEKDQASH